MEENFRFWFEAFRNSPERDSAWQPNTIHLFEALSDAIDVITPAYRFNKKELEAEFKDIGFDVRNLNSYACNREWFGATLVEFKDRELPEEGGFDLVAIFYEFTGELIPDLSAYGTFLTKELRAEVDKYRLLYPTAKMAAVASKSDKDGVAAIDAAKEKAVTHIKYLKEEIKEELNKKVSDSYAFAMTKINEQIATAESDTITRFKNEAKPLLENAKKEVKAELNETFITDEARTMWEDKAEGHRKRFYWGASVFVALIVMAFAGLICNWGDITKAIKDMSNDAQTIPWGSLLVFTAPTLAYAWILRLVSRFTLQNLNLADDAHQRGVMVRTYLNLIGKSAAHPDAHRGIMLNALFRPLPGANDKDIQPPNLSDIIGGKPT